MKLFSAGLCLILFISSRGFAGPLTSFELSQAKFANDELPSRMTEDTPHTSIGAATSIMGFGLTYTQSISSRSTLWGGLLYTPWRLGEGNFPKNGVYHVERQTNSFDLMAGADRTFNPFHRRYWYLMAGAGVSLHQGHWKVSSRSAYTKEEVTFLKNDEVTVHETERYAQIFYRFGIFLPELRLAGQRATGSFTLAPTLVRAPAKFVVPGPEGHRVDLSSKSLSLLLELNLQL